MLSNELNNLAAQIEDAERLKSGKPVDPSFIAKKLRILAIGVGALELVKVGDSARLIPAECRHQALAPRSLPDAVILLAGEVQS